MDAGVRRRRGNSRISAGTRLRACSRLISSPQSNATNTCSMPVSCLSASSPAWCERGPDATLSVVGGAILPVYGSVGQDSDPDPRRPVRIGILTYPGRELACQAAHDEGGVLAAETETGGHGGADGVI